MNVRNTKRSGASSDYRRKIFTARCGYRSRNDIRNWAGDLSPSIGGYLETRMPSFAQLCLGLGICEFPGRYHVYRMVEIYHRPTDWVSSFLCHFLRLHLKDPTSLPKFGNVNPLAPQCAPIRRTKLEL